MLLSQRVDSAMQFELPLEISFQLGSQDRAVQEET